VAESADIVVVGGGVIGLSVAWHLVREGAAVTVLERERVGCEASSASAGMLSPLAESRAPGPFMELGLASLRLYPDFARDVGEASGVACVISGPWMLRVATNEDEAEALTTAYTEQKEKGLKLELLEGDGARRAEPGLGPSIVAAILSMQETHVEAPHLVRALALGTSRLGGRILERTPVVGFETDGRRVVAVRTPRGRIPCGHLVIAAGAWSEALAERLNARLPIFPVRGQIVALTAMPPPLHHTVYSPIGYIVPTADGRILLGSTQEKGHFDSRPTASGMSRLLSMGPSLVPALAEAPFHSAWAGLRPGCEDDLPVIGRLPSTENAYAATGHFRSGVLMAPVTGKLLAQAILSGDEDPFLKPFQPGRFGRA
jgi:glycine oxidase